MAGNFTAIADFDPFLNLNESADLDVVADFATVKICEAKNTDVLPQFDVRSNYSERLIGQTHRTVNRDGRSRSSGFLSEFSAQPERCVFDR